MSGGAGSGRRTWKQPAGPTPGRGGQVGRVMSVKETWEELSERYGRLEQRIGEQQEDLAAAGETHPGEGRPGTVAPECDKALGGVV